MEYLVTTQEFNTPSKKLNKEMNGIITAFRDGDIHDIEDEKVVAKLVKILVKEGFIAE